VKVLTLFLNELSLMIGEGMTRERLSTPVLSTIYACVEARTLRPDLVLSGNVSLLGLFFMPGHFSLAAILGGGQYSDEWRFIANMEELSTGEHFVQEAIVTTENVCFLGQPSEGMRRAAMNDSAIVSFPVNQLWEHAAIDAERQTLEESGNINLTQISIRNISNPTHVAVHEEWINRYGREVSPSSLVYEGDGFVIRMFFDDHEPPHFHVMLRRDSSFYAAKISIQSLDILEGRLAPALRRRIIDWARARVGSLMENWSRCRKQLHPFTIEDA